MTAQTESIFPRPNNTVVSIVRNTGSARATGYASEMSQYLYASIKPTLQTAPQKPPAMANMMTFCGRVHSSPEPSANGSMVRNNDEENNAKNSIEDLPLLLQRKCHRLCIAMELAIKPNAIRFIGEESPCLCFLR